MGKKPVSDPTLLQQLDGGRRPITDPSVLQELEGPSAEAQQISQYMQSGDMWNAAPEQKQLSWGDTGVDTVKSLGVGLGEGGIMLAGLPGDAQELVGSGVRWAGKAAGLEPQAWDQAADFVGGLIPDFPTSQGIQQGIEQYTGEFYEPKTVFGEYARTAGQFAPAAMTGGGGATARLARALIPAFASETAGQATKGTEAEPYARLAFALASTPAAWKAGQAPEKFAQSRAVKNATIDVGGGVQKPATINNVSRLKTKKYDEIENAGVSYDPKDVQDLGGYLDKKLASYKSGTARDITQNIIDRGAGSRMTGNSFKFSEIEDMRKSAGDLARNPMAADRKAGAIIADAIDEFQMNAATRGPRVNATQKEARELAQRTIQHRMISDMIENAKGYTSGIESGLRNQFANVLRSEKRRRKFTPEVLAAMEDVVHGRRGLEMFGRTFGFDITKFSGRNAIVPFLTNAAAMTAGANPLLGVAGTVAKEGSRRLTESAARKVLATALAGRGNVPAVQKLSKTDRLASAVVAGQAGGEQLRAPPLEITVRPPTR